MFVLVKAGEGVFDMVPSVRQGPSRLFGGGQRVLVYRQTGGKLNMCYNAIDRHVLREGGANDLAMIWEGDEPTDVQHFTYGDVQTMMLQNTRGQLLPSI
mmetsp:Transcript_23532/g.34215  ORF Transcript_23532/g.34215 Transcript_23532/m.34215 type:complete len:99 (-) Transcript_23532:295-591(-)